MIGFTALPCFLWRIQEWRLFVGAIHGPMDGLRGVPSPDRAMAFDDSDYMLWSVFKCFVLLWCMVVPGGSSVLGLADVP